MTQIDEKANTTAKPSVGIYDETTKTTANKSTSRAYDISETITTSSDMIHWGPVLAGLFAALATLATLTVLGLAIGASSYSAGDSARSFGIGAGIWGGISALIAFLVGGWLASRSAAQRGESNGILQGAMVWFVAIPLMLYALGSGIGALASTAGSVAGTAAQVAGQAAGQAAGQVASNPALQGTAQSGVQDAAAAAQATAQAVAAQVTPARVEQATDAVGRGAWGTLLSLGLAAAAAIGGGYLGTRQQPAPRVARRAF